MTYCVPADVDALHIQAERDLDWPLLCERLAAYATSVGGAESFRRLRPHTNRAEACAAAQCTREALDLHRSTNAWPVGDVPDVAFLIEQLERQAVATGSEMLHLGELLASASMLREFARSVEHQYPAVAGTIRSAPSLDGLRRRIDDTLERDGSVSSRASKTLARMRAEVQRLRQDLLAQLRQLMTKYADVLQDQFYAERGGRFVIPLRHDAHRAVDGIVLDTSASGNTLYMEPRELSPLSNRLRVAQTEVIHEEHRILVELSASASEQAPQLREALAACTAADVLRAVCRFAAESDSIVVEPEDVALVDLRQARHPLLLGKTQVVPNDLALASGEVWVISGPNAGGKSVALKCVGLLALMVRAGLPIPVAANSKMGWFSSVVCDMGDSQSIVANLSTFSAHMKVLSSILGIATRDTLILLDEVAAGTDPEQGAALAVSILEAMAGRGATVATTTHYELLKEHGALGGRFRNVAVGFDLDTLLPSYRLLPGVAGPSTAFAVARRYGVPDEVVDAAEALIPEISVRRETLLDALAAARTQTDSLMRSAEAEASEQRALRVQAERLRDEIDESYRKELEAQYRDLVAAVRRARADVLAVERRLREGSVSQAELRDLARSIDGAASLVAMGGPMAEAVRPRKSESTSARPPHREEVVAGAIFDLPRFGAQVEVLQVMTNGEARVACGSLRVAVPISDLRFCGGNRPKRSRGLKQSVRLASRTEDMSPRAAPSHPIPVRVDRNTLDLRGCRVDEALSRVEVFVDELLRQGDPAGFVLHGHGTGALKQAVRAHLQGLAHVARSAPADRDDGGDAFTVFWLEG